MRACSSALAVLAAVVVGLHVDAATATSAQRLHAVFHVSWKEVSCPKKTPATTSCYLNVGRTVVPGLGAAQERYVLLVEHTDSTCADWRFTAVLTIAGRGSIQASALRPGCFSPYSQDGVSRFRITAGSGAYRGARGSGKIASTGTETGPAQGTGTDVWTGTLAAGRRLDVAASSAREAGTLQLHAVFDTRWQGTECPAGSSALAVCYSNVGHGRVPGLGDVTESYIAIVDDQAAKCVYPHFTGVLAVAGKGELDISAKSPDCVPPLRQDGTVDYVVTGGSGAYAGATGNGRQASLAHETSYAQGIGTDTWDGTLVVPDVEFDLTPPVLQGVRNIVARLRPGAKSVAVRFMLAAKDDLDGVVPVACKPKSGSRFRVGRTKVTCEAVDTSGNTATAGFAVTVRRSSSSRVLFFSTTRASELSLRATFPIKNFAAPCPAGTPPATECFAISTTAAVPGLGTVTEKYMAFDDQSDTACRHTSWPPVVLSVAGKGEIDTTLAAATRCDGEGQFIGAGHFTVIGGSGIYAGASGSGSENASGLDSDTWTGTLSVPGLEFDTTAPAIAGARRTTVRVPAGVKRARVRFGVTARDAVDGSVPVMCLPRSGSLFRLGRTSVSCSATDSSANTAGATFAVVVKRR